MLTQPFAKTSSVFLNILTPVQTIFHAESYKRHLLWAGVKCFCMELAVGFFFNQYSSRLGKLFDLWATAGSKT